MAIVLEANYQKRLGLPNYSSHAYSVTVRTEVGDLTQVENASSRLYRQLQEAVDNDIKQPGFLPGRDDMPPVAQFERKPINNSAQSPDSWNCSPKQQEFIEKLIQEHKLDYAEVDNLSQERFGFGLTRLSKPRASQMIDLLIDTHGQSPSYGNQSRVRGSVKGGCR